jgi:hypothetical protein
VMRQDLGASTSFGMGGARIEDDCEQPQGTSRE